MRLVVWCYISNYLDITAQSHASADDVYLQVMNWKGMVGARQQSFRQARRSLAAGGNTKALELEKDLSAATHQLSALTRSTSVAGPEKEQQLAVLGEKVEGLQKQLAAASVEYQKEFQQTRRTPQDLRRVLPADTVLIDLLSYEFADGGSQPVARRLVWSTETGGLCAAPTSRAARRAGTVRTGATGDYCLAKAVRRG